ncbi:site-2 protease family protein [Paenibacillus mucilaginosus]|uniref:Peptidase M50 n=2 Tax=Paenibacillus mucilaginosus TaxID=61624 RepID=H6NIG8_9BACL|nr:site-2 protease family protein [Paenibacillus mucilaginosus]AEI42675.1 peptidase M50 [Paenibacillus mucilaginosus KNP414]AFC32279.1 peptidase M50 [Paenibacillus mucilaginosus 3016]MCG7217076.1 site-2 protease family protein [Paenibacillus mucilaginosus]WDM26064.1 site-2 protease family protein [Paenibacillus mucilaginosus]WFA20781.1 site-2 protease family protein [Paenibacillus mucilaginosus]
MDLNFLAYPVEHLPFVFLALLLGFTVHEFSHAILADKFGDPTPRSMGRVTLNPRVHLDVLGTIFFLIIGIGWAKPVLVNRSRFASPRLMGILVSVAGPVSNLVLALISVIIYFALIRFGVLTGASVGVRDALSLFFNYLVSLNVLLFILNLIPFPPLDGYRILEDLLPRRVMLKVKPYEQWLFYAILLMFFIPPLRNVTLGPIFALQDPIMNGMQALAAGLLGMR